MLERTNRYEPTKVVSEKFMAQTKCQGALVKTSSGGYFDSFPIASLQSKIGSYWRTLERDAKPTAEVKKALRVFLALTALVAEIDKAKIAAVKRARGWLAAYIHKQKREGEAAV
jgi:hypothetical protein